MSAEQVDVDALINHHAGRVDYSNLHSWRVTLTAIGAIKVFCGVNEKHAVYIGSCWRNCIVLTIPPHYYNSHSCRFFVRGKGDFAVRINAVVYVYDNYGPSLFLKPSFIPHVKMI